MVEQVSEQEEVATAPVPSGQGLSAEQAEGQDSGGTETHDATPGIEERYQESQAQVEKLTRDLKSQQTGRMKQEQRDAILEGIRDEQDAQRETNEALIKALSNGSTEELPEELSKIRQKTTQTQAAGMFVQRAQDLWTDMEASVLDDNGQEILSLKDAPELAEMRDIWDAAANRGDMVGLSKAVLITNRATRTKEREMSKAASKQAAKKALQDVGAIETDIGAGTGGGEKSFEKIRDAYIADPYDAKISRAYAAARRTKGL